MASSSRRLADKKRRETIRESMDKASEGVAAANEIIELLEKDNAIFGRYIDFEAERERAERATDAAEQEAELNRAVAAPKNCGSRQSLEGGVTSKDDGSFFLTGLGVESKEEEVEEVKPAGGDDDHVGSSSRRFEEEDGDIAATLCLAARLKEEARERVATGATELRREVREGVRTLCASVVERPEPRCVRAEKQSQDRPPAELATNTAERAELRGKPHRHAESPKVFQARPLPAMYGVAEEEEKRMDVVERTAEWQARMRAKRDAEREARRTRAAEETLAALARTQGISEDSQRSWDRAREQAERKAKEAAEACRRRDDEKRRRHEYHEAREAEELRALKAQRADFLAAKQARLATRVKSDHPVDRPTKASIAGHATAKKAATSPTAACEEDPTEAKVDRDPYEGLEAFKFDPRVLELLGEEPSPSPSPRAQPASPEEKEQQERAPPASEVEDDGVPAPNPNATTAEGFFDVLSSAERGRVRCRDARDFLPSSMGRTVVDDGVVLLVGALAEPPYTEHVICALFDRSLYTERVAFEWWRRNYTQIIY